MKISTALTFLTTSLALLTSACGAVETEPLETNNREVFFDGAEIKAIVDEQPDVTFFVDVRDGIVNHFDQSEEVIDFSHFVFQCPSMPVPVPMEDILEDVDEEAYSKDYWSIQSMQTEDGFRRAPICPDDCFCECPNDIDCNLFC